MCNEMPVESSEPNEMSWVQAREMGLDGAAPDMVVDAGESEA